VCLCVCIVYAFVASALGRGERLWCAVVIEQKHSAFVWGRAEVARQQHTTKLELGNWRTKSGALSTVIQDSCKAELAVLCENSYQRKVIMNGPRQPK